MLHLRSAHLLLLHATLRGIYELSRLFGLMAATLPQMSGNGNVADVRCSRYWRLHGYLVAVFVLCYSPHAFYMIYTRMDFLRQNALLFIVGCQHFALLLVSTVFMVYMHTTRQMCIIRWLNKLLSCRRQLLQLLHTRRLRESLRQLHTRDHLWTVFLLSASIVGSSSHSVFVLSTDPMSQRSGTYFCSVLFYYGLQLGLQLCLGLYVLALLLISHLLHHCNLLLDRILSDAVQVHQSLVKWGMPQRWRLHAAQQHWLALELWRLWRLHGQLLQLSQRLCSFHSIQLLAFVAFVSIECVLHIFFSYFVQFSRWWLRKFRQPAPFNIYGLITISSLFVQLAFVIMQTHRLRCIYCKTRRTLSRAALAVPPSCSKALRQTLDFYGLQLQLNERIYKMSACGLFEMNNALLFDIMQTILIYVTILIQFDKIINA
ncbi:putative gustatory receptor 77a [Drosophila innubila]|uniref:putative gustatory receptor 77a n=1 Tax=Drosophila innubila TaxID=198719 RepID=UPI00148C597F|nr:putative gustatory receptor 77a [Drosophila innubila]